ncbi:unnamed protein product, partial [Oppiella nova]
FNYNILILLAVVTTGILAGECPSDPKILAPCECKPHNETYNYINCAEYVKLDVLGVFKNLSKALEGKTKQFYQLRFSNKLIEYLPANAFADIEFQEVYVSFASNMKRFDANALNGTRNTVTKLIVERSPIVDNNGTDDNDLFKAVRQLPRLKQFELSWSDVTEIPAGSFQSHPTLERLKFYDNLQMTKVGHQAFSQLKNLFYISIETSVINAISAEAFSQESAEREFIVRLDANDKAVLPPEAFQAIKRPVNLHLTKDNLSPYDFHYIPESTYKPFLDQHPKHRIFSTLGSGDCSDKRNDWLRDRSPKQWFDENCSY